MMVLHIHCFFLAIHIYTRLFVCTVLREVDLGLNVPSCTHIFFSSLYLYTLVTSSGHFQTCHFLVHLTNCTVSSASSLGQRLSWNILMIGKFVLTQSSITFLYWLLWATNEFLDISWHKTLFSFHFAFLCIDACMEHQQSLYANLVQSGILVSSWLWLCIRFRLMLVAHEIMTLPSTLTTWNFTLWKHLSSWCRANSSQDPITGIFCLV